MSEPSPVSRPPRLRITTGILMVWVGAVAVALGFLKGDIAEAFPRSVFGWLVAVVILATIFGLPWLSYHYDRSPESLRPRSAASLKAEHLLVVGLLGWITAAVILLGLLFSMILLI